MKGVLAEPLENTGDASLEGMTEPQLTPRFLPSSACLLES